MSKVERLYHLHNILSQRRTPITRHQLMERLECSQATLYRLVGELRDFLGAPIEQDPDTKGYYYDRALVNAFELPGIWISPEELQALLTARQVLANVQPGLLEDELDALQGRISNLLQQKGVEAEDETGSRIHIHHTAARPVPDAMFQDVLSALVRRKRLAIHYHGRERDTLSDRTISPQRLTQYRNSWYLDAWCHKAEGLRSFALERIQNQAVLDETAIEVTAKDIADQFDQSYGIFSGPALNTAELLFSANRARWVADEVWHVDQTGHWLDDGRYALKVPFSRPQELIMDILRHVPEVEVKSPEFLKAAVVDALKQALETYSGS